MNTQDRICGPSFWRSENAETERELAGLERFEDLSSGSSVLERGKVLMPKPQTRAELILSEARQRVETARARVRSVQEDLSAAKAVLEAHSDAYQALEKALTPKPRRRSTPAAQASLPETKTKAA